MSVNSIESNTLSNEDYINKKSDNSPKSSIDSGINPKPTDLSASLQEEKFIKTRTIKEEWIKHEMQARQDEFTQYESINLFVGSWNVNGKASTQNLNVWFGNLDADLFVVGIQEFDLSAEAFIINDGMKEMEWTEKIELGLGEKSTEFYKVASKQLVGLFIICYANKKHYKNIKQTTTDSVGCGIMGLMGNKGAVAIRLKFKDSYLCFVNSHLAANLNMIDRRNQDYNEICRRIAFPFENSYDSLSTFHRSRESLYSKTNGVYSVFDCDHLIWFGDLNYRISIGNDLVKQYLSKKDIDGLLKYDQLIEQKSKNKVFVNFEEGPIKFNPTYKYDIGTNNYDTSEKQRCPSWCDRILFHSRDKSHRINIIEYSSVDKLDSSDHKPIYSTMRVDIKNLLADNYAKVYSDVVKELDKFENESMPDARVSSSYIDFGEITYNTRKYEELLLTNTGKHYLQFEFVPKFDETLICKPWIWIDPISGMILPGEKTVIRLVAHVDNSSAETLNLKIEKAEDILVLHLVNGKDYFISVTANYTPTLFGIGLENLTRLPKMPISSIKNINMLPLENMHSVPRPIWRMVEFIHKHGLDIPDLFLSPADPSLIENIKASLDKDTEFDKELLLGASTCNAIDDVIADDSTKYGGVYAMCETLIDFLDALPEPVIPYEFHEQCFKAATIGKEACINVLENMSRAHINTFLYLTAFSREILGWNSQLDNAVKIEKLSLVLSSVILKDSIDLPHENPEAAIELKKKLIMYFIVDDVCQLDIDTANTA